MLLRRPGFVTLAAAAFSLATAAADWVLPQVNFGYIHLLPILAVQRYAGRRVAIAFAVFAAGLTYLAELRGSDALGARLFNSALQLAVFGVTIAVADAVQRRDAALREALRRRSAEREFRFLVDAGDALGNLDEGRISARVAELTVPTLGDACVVYRPRGDLIVAEAFAASDRARLARLQALHARHPHNPRRPAVTAIRERRPLLATMSEEHIAEHTTGEDHARLLRDVGIGSLISVPLVGRDRVLGALLLLSFAGRRRFDDTDLAFAELYARRAALAIENAELYQREHRVADEYQRASLPVSLPEREGIAFSAVYEAGRGDAQVGGDWYDAFELDDGRMVLSVGDVAGSGLSAAVTMAAVRQAIRGAARILADPVAILDAADATVRALAGDRFATAFVAILDPLDRSLEFAGAGHLTPFLRFPDGRIDRLRATGLPLGLRERNPDGASDLAAVPPGTLLVFFTDGIIETTHDVLAGLGALRAALARDDIANAPLPAVALRDALLPEQARDDVAILSVRIGEVGASAWRFPSEDRRAAQTAKQEVIRTLRAAGMSERDAASAEVVFGELSGNVARHAGGDVEVLLDLAAPQPVLHVLDRGAGYAYAAVTGPQDLFAESGRGLFIATRLARGLTVSRRPGGASHARAVLWDAGRSAERGDDRRHAGTTHA